MENTITLSYEDLSRIINASQKAFIETGKYEITKNEAEIQFGKTLVSFLITNKLINDARVIKGARIKCRFLVSEIITAIETLKIQNKDIAKLH